MAAAIIELFDDPDKKQTIAENAYRMVNENYNWPVMARKMVEVCRRLVESARES
jgi:glycosyltransferase involved in cell wall biosynthesis